MLKSMKRCFCGPTLALAGALLAVGPLTGCQVSTNGQTLPSPYYLQDDVQYFAPGPEFILANEAAAMKAQAEEEAMLR